MEPVRPQREPVLDTHLTPIYYTTGVFGVIFILGLIAPRGPNAGIVRTSVSLSAFCMWLFWFVIYVSQMNPMAGPIIHNTTLIWISRKWGLEIDKTFLRSRDHTEADNDGFDVELTTASRIVVDDVQRQTMPIALNDADVKTFTVANIPDEDIKPNLRRVGIEPDVLIASEMTTKETEHPIPIDEEPLIRTLPTDIDLESPFIGDEERKRRANSGPNGLPSDIVLRDV